MHNPPHNNRPGHRPRLAETLQHQLATIHADSWSPVATWDHPDSAYTAARRLREQHPDLEYTARHQGDTSALWARTR